VIAAKGATMSEVPPPTPMGSRVDPKLLELLVCPLTKMPLDYDAGRKELISRTARLAFPIIDGMPVMVVSEARALTDDEIEGRRK
jgi:hypothetical protein